MSKCARDIRLNGAGRQTEVLFRETKKILVTARCGHSRKCPNPYFLYTLKNYNSS